MGEDDGFLMEALRRDSRRAKPIFSFTAMTKGVIYSQDLEQMNFFVKLAETGIGPGPSRSKLEYLAKVKMAVGMTIFFSHRLRGL
jgi:hypothetical protein